MRITIIQTEIEEAIAEKVLRQMSIKDGMELKINLSATRGDEGMTATIDVVQKVEDTLEMPSKGTKARRMARSPETAQETTEAAPATDAPATEEAVPDKAPVEAQAETEAEAPKTGSIFANLRKPVNTPVDEA